MAQEYPGRTHRQYWSTPPRPPSLVLAFCEPALVSEIAGRCPWRRLSSSEDSRKYVMNTRIATSLLAVGTSILFPEFWLIWSTGVYRMSLEVG